MKNYRNSDYAANKYAEGIVYRFADEVVEVTLEDYLRENPGKSASNFAELKAISDDLYLNSDRAEYRQTWKTVPLKGFEEADGFCVPSAEAEAIDIPEEMTAKEMQRALMIRAMQTLTETQRRRFVMYHAKRKTEKQIAEIEFTTQQAISKSLYWANKKVNKFLSAV